MIDLVIFGATGDLTRRKLLPALYQLEAAHKLPEGLRILGVGRKPVEPGRFREQARESLESFEGKIEPRVWDRLLGRLGYEVSDYSVESLQAMGRRLAPSVLFYLALPPDVFPTVAANLGRAGLSKERGGFRRLVVEKPFGHDLESALELQHQLLQHWDEPQILRIDHYLGKETVQNVLVFRFANAWLEPLWNNLHVAQVQITVAEEIGVEGRGEFYDGVGALRDIVQNHMMQLLTLSALEPPPKIEADLLHNEKVKVLRSIRPLSGENLVRGQYVGYLEEAGLESSSTETFAALKLYLDNWRWKGVPFYLRTGKRLARKHTEVALQFKGPPQRLFEDTDCNPEPGWLVLEVQPHEGMHLDVEVKTPGLQLSSRRTSLRASYRSKNDGELSAYATLILDALYGDRSLFLRFDEVEWAWRVLEPVLRPVDPPELYAPGSFGPKNQFNLLENGHRWRKLG
ncbi:MAG: glucose-6-phosphate dehydrogenase [Meiothermus sp.]